MLLQSLIKDANVSASTVSSLEKKALLKSTSKRFVAIHWLRTLGVSDVEHNLTAGQSTVLAQIEEQMNAGDYSAFLLHGVTGSGKTEIYMRAMNKALSLGRSAMMLVPEIALTPVFSRRLRARFGDQVAIFHSSLQKGERFDEWTRVRNGEARVVIGTRSAVFAPVKNLGLIVVDEEHESSYRQQESPYYNARDVAIVRAQKESATVVLGSATPSLESFHNARKGKYHICHDCRNASARGRWRKRRSSTCETCLRDMESRVSFPMSYSKRYAKHANVASSRSFCSTGAAIRASYFAARAARRCSVQTATSR